MVGVRPNSWGWWDRRRWRSAPRWPTTTSPSCAPSWTARCRRAPRCRSTLWPATPSPCSPSCSNRMSPRRAPANCCSASGLVCPASRTPTGRAWCRRRCSGGATCPSASTSPGRSASRCWSTTTSTRSPWPRASTESAAASITFSPSRSAAASGWASSSTASSTAEPTVRPASSATSTPAATLCAPAASGAAWRRSPQSRPWSLQPAAAASSARMPARRISLPLPPPATGVRWRSTPPPAPPSAGRWLQLPWCSIRRP